MSLAKPRLRVVEDPKPIDIHTQMRAAILARDWGSMHIAADRRQAIDLPEQVRRVWR